MSEIVMVHTDHVLSNISSQYRGRTLNKRCKMMSQKLGMSTYLGLILIVPTTMMNGRTKPGKGLSRAYTLLHAHTAIFHRDSGLNMHSSCLALALQGSR